MLVHVENLPLWEIAHYWHDLDPRESTTHHLPLKVRDTLMVLAMWCGKKLAYRVEHDKHYQYEILKQAPRFTARHYRHTIKKAIELPEDEQPTNNRPLKPISRLNAAITLHPKRARDNFHLILHAV